MLPSLHCLRLSIQDSCRLVPPPGRRRDSPRLDTAHHHGRGLHLRDGLFLHGHVSVSPTAHLVVGLAASPREMLGGQDRAGHGSCRVHYQLWRRLGARNSAYLHGQVAQHAAAHQDSRRMSPQLRGCRKHCNLYPDLFPPKTSRRERLLVYV